MILTKRLGNMDITDIKYESIHLDYLKGQENAGRSFREFGIWTV